VFEPLEIPYAVEHGTRLGDTDLGRAALSLLRYAWLGGGRGDLFAYLRSLGIAATGHAFPDHHSFAPRDLALPGARAILMTEKDAVKCEAFADERCWYLPVRAHLDPALVTRVEEALRGPEAP